MAVERNKVGNEQSFLMDLSRGIVGWEDDKDPQNPRNYPPSRKWFLLGIVSIVTLISPFASTLFAPAAGYAAQEFGNASSIQSTLAVTAYLFGYAVGPLFLSPLSELYGRRIVLNVATALFVVFQIGCALAPNIASLIVFRTITGMGGSACLTIGGGVISDLFGPEQRGLAMSIFSLGPLLGPVIGPICGAFIAQDIGWRWIFWVLAITGGTFTTFVIIFNRETNPVILMERKTRKLQKELDRPELRSCYENKDQPRVRTNRAAAVSFLLNRLTTPMRLLIFSPIVTFIALYIAVLYGCLYLLFTTVTTVFEDTYHWPLSTSGLANIGLGLGFLIGQILFGLTSDRVLKRLKSRNQNQNNHSDNNNNTTTPEMRLPPAILFAPLVPISFFWYGWSVQQPTHWIVPITGLAPFAVGMIGIFSTLQTYVIDCYPRHAASGIAAITVTRSLFGALLPLAGPEMYRALGYGWGNTLLGLVALLLVPVPVGFYRFGAGLRERGSWSWIRKPSSTPYGCEY
ncbi:major facilitator superfamily domain-containing protein [Aspergillus heterothallicus]